MQPKPLILTLAIEDSAQQRFNLLREAYFPPERNFIPAHITLFHALPGDESETICTLLQQTAEHAAPFPVAAAGLQFLGRGVAYRLSSARLLALHAGIASAWREWLSPQDRQRFAPHIVVQNKVEPAQARATLAALNADFSPFSFCATGLQLWRYLGGPWEALEVFPFKGESPEAPLAE